MHRSRSAALAAALLSAAILAACEKGVEANLITDAELNADIAATSGDALALSVSTMTGNESTASLSTTGAPPSNLVSNSITFERSRTCYDADGVEVPDCNPRSTVRTIVTHVQLDGSRSGSNFDGSKTWFGGVHRVADDSLTRVFDGPTETQRVHNAVAMAHDTASWDHVEKSKFMSVVSHDSVRAVTFGIPRTDNPFPISGSIVRLDSVHAIHTKGDRTETRDVVRRVEITFPADANGDVAIKVGATVCTLNLLSRKTKDCS